MFKQVLVDIGGKTVYDSGQLHAYKSIIEAELNYSKEVKSSWLASQGYYENDKIDDKDSTGFKKGKALFAEGKEVELCAPVSCEIFQSDRVLPAQTPVKLTLHRNNDAFCLLNLGTAAHNFKLKVERLEWYVCCLELQPSVHMGLEATLNRNPALYPVHRVEVRKVLIPNGSYYAPHSPVYQGQIPRRVILGFVEAQSQSGIYTKSPFTFAPHTIKSLHLEIAGNVYPRDPLVLDFTNDKYQRAYVNMLDCVGVYGSNKSNGITLDQFKTSHCLFAFDLTADADPESGAWGLIEKGAVNVHCEFTTASPGLAMIVYLEFDSMYMINHARNVFTDFTA